jgi:hypothetical protein
MAAARHSHGTLSWDLAPAGNRFLIISPHSSGPSSLNMILNWRPNRH